MRRQRRPPLLKLELECLYTERLSSYWDTELYSSLGGEFKSILKLADSYKMDKLKDQCLQYAMEALEHPNCSNETRLFYLRQSQVYGVPKLTEKVTEPLAKLPLSKLRALKNYRTTYLQPVLLSRVEILEKVRAISQGATRADYRYVPSQWETSLQSNAGVRICFTLNLITITFH